MIIPIRCYTCGKCISNRYEYFKKRVNEKKLSNKEELNKPSVIDVNVDEIRKTPEGEVLDELGYNRYCCRKIFLGHIDLIYEIN